MTIDVRDVTFEGEGRELQGRLALPAGPGPRPAVIVIHEIFGLTDPIREVAERLAAEGYAALAVDLFAGGRRAVCMARAMAGLLFDPLEHRGIRDLRRALAWLAERPEVDGERLGAIGFCMGGSFAIAWAAGDERLKVIAPFYAQNPRPLEAVERLCPVVGSYPERDFTAPMGRRLEAALDRSGIEHDIVVYPGARHSFFDPTRPRTHHPEAARDAWQRTLAFFGRRLAEPPAPGNGP